MRFVGERKAVAALMLALYVVLYLMNGLLGPGQLQTLFLAMAAIYLTGFLGVVAGWFWARWYAQGLGFFGVAISALGIWQMGLEPVILFIGGTHVIIVLALLGRGPASAFDGRKDWRERWKMDDDAANRLGKAILRAGITLPILVMGGLGPKQGAAEWAGVIALILGVAGLRALVTNRAWGVLALGGAAVACGIAEFTGRAALFVPVHGFGASAAGVAWTGTMVAPVLGAALCLAAAAPLAGPAVRFLRAR